MHLPGMRARGVVGGGGGERGRGGERERESTRLLFFLNRGKNTNMRPILLAHVKCMTQSITEHNVVQ